MDDNHTQGDIIMKINQAGRWLAWLLLDQATPAADMPSRRHLVWRTRSVQQEQIDHYWSEAHAGVVPCVEAWLLRLNVTRWFDPPITLYRTEVEVQVFVPGLPGWRAGTTPVSTFSRHESFVSEQVARADFAAHQANIRAALVGVSRSPRARSTS